MARTVAEQKVWGSSTWGAPEAAAVGVRVLFMPTTSGTTSPHRNLRGGRDLLSVGASAAQAAPTTLSTEKAPTNVAAYAGTVMWSTKDDVTGGYKLVKSVGGAAPVASASPSATAPFDVDLGTNRDGSLYAVYTRGGFIYRLRVSNGAEERLNAISLGGQNSHPTIMRGRIAFLHSGRGHSELRLAGVHQLASTSRRVLVKGVINHVELGLTQIAYTTHCREDTASARPRSTSATPAPVVTTSSTRRTQAGRTRLASQSPRSRTTSRRSSGPAPTTGRAPATASSGTRSAPAGSATRRAARAIPRAPGPAPSSVRRSPPRWTPRRTPVARTRASSTARSGSPAR